MRTVKRFLLLIIPMLAATAAIPDLAQLQKMIARFQPTELRVDVSKLSPGDRQALGKLIEAARVLNDIFLTQMWSGNHALVRQAAARHHAAGQGPAGLFLAEQMALVRDRRSCSVSSRCSAQEAAGREFLSRGHDAGGVRSLGEDAFEDRSASRPKASSPSFIAMPIESCTRFPTARSIARISRNRRSCWRRPPALTDNATLKKFLDRARGGVPLQRLLRQRHRLDGSGCAARYHDRPL